MMKKLCSLTLFTCVSFFVSQALAQEHYTPGAVSRVILLKVKPGKMNDFMLNLRENTKPLFEEYKKQGVITDYRFSLNQATVGRDDWDVSISLRYKDFAALDGLAERTDPITLKHFGSKEARQKALDKRTEYSETISSRLVREITLK